MIEPKHRCKNNKNCNDRGKRAGGKRPTLTTFFLTAIAAITGKNDRRFSPIATNF